MCELTREPTVKESYDDGVLAMPDQQEILIAFHGAGSLVEDTASLVFTVKIPLNKFQAYAEASESEIDTLRRFWKAGDCEMVAAIMMHVAGRESEAGAIVRLRSQP